MAKKKRSNLLLGVVTGTVLGVLFAPKKGKKLREEIKKERAGGGVGLGSLKEGFVSMGKEMAGSAKAVYEMEEVQHGIDKAKEFASDLFVEGKNKAEEIADETSKKVVKKAKKAAKKAKKKATKFTKKRIAKKKK